MKTPITKNKFSVYRAPIKNTTPLKTIDIYDVFRVVTSHKYKAITEHYRSIADKKEAKKFKAEHFDYVSFSGVFKKRANSHISSHSGLICIDIDSIIPQELQDTIKTAVISPVLMFRSPSQGLKVVYSVDVDSQPHIAYFRALEQFYLSTYNIEIDVSGKDLSRACFLCYDADCYMSARPTLLNKAFIETFPKPRAKEIERISAPTSIKGNVIDIAVKMILEAKQGQKHVELLKASRLVGGAIATGAIQEYDAIAALSTAISQRNVDSLEDAITTIKKGIENGKAAPLIK